METAGDSRRLTEDDMLDLSTARDRAINEWLEQDLIIWLTTVGPSGRPHTIPVWFDWDGESILIFSEPETRKIRDLRGNPAVSLALQTRDEGEEVIFFEGDAALTTESSAELLTERYAKKYAHLFPRIDSSPEKMAGQYSQPIRIRNAKVKAWGVGGT
jgi:PPOX class probable F420-dependent enzyme